MSTDANEQLVLAKIRLIEEIRENLKSANAWRDAGGHHGAYTESVEALTACVAGGQGSLPNV